MLAAAHFDHDLAHCQRGYLLHDRRSIGGASGSPCAGVRRWVSCSRASSRPDERHDIWLPSAGHFSVPTEPIPALRRSSRKGSNL